MTWLYVSRVIDTVEWPSRSVYVKLAGGDGRDAGDSEKVMGGTLPITETHEEIAEQLVAFGPAGIDHLQIVLDPITAAGVEELAEILQLR